MRLAIDTEEQNKDRCSDSDTRTFHSHTVLDTQPKSMSLQTFQQKFGIGLTEELCLHTSKKDKLATRKKKKKRKKTQQQHQNQTKPWKQEQRGLELIRNP